MSISKYLWMLVILASCATAKNFYDAASQITFKKNPCFGRCPEFTLTIKGDGNCILNGTKNITHIGNFNLKLDDAETKSIFEDFQKAGFDTLQENISLKRPIFQAPFSHSLTTAKLKPSPHKWECRTL
ncbi:MAG: DUF6438 domain-containing protein [Bacteroidia bacterium]